MCGIVGLVRSDGKSVDEALLARMNDAIRHRGPDEDGFYVDGSVGLAMRRLAIIDLKAANSQFITETPPDRFQWRFTTSNFARSSKVGPHVLYQQHTEALCMLTINTGQIVRSICVACLFLPSDRRAGIISGSRSRRQAYSMRK